MFAVLAEDRSDADALVVLVKRLSGEPRQRVLKHGFSGCGELCRKAASHVQDFAAQGAEHFIVCHDADDNDPQAIKRKVRTCLAQKAPMPEHCCIVVPVQELEAWIIADERAITTVIPSLTIRGMPRPERQASPKEWLVRESRRGRSQPLYVPTIHNAKVAEHLDTETVAAKCPSFRELVEFVQAAKRPPIA